MDKKLKLNRTLYLFILLKVVDRRILHILKNALIDYEASKHSPRDCEKDAPYNNSSGKQDYKK